MCLFQDLIFTCAVSGTCLRQHTICIKFPGSLGLISVIMAFILGMPSFLQALQRFSPSIIRKSSPVNQISIGSTCPFFRILMINCSIDSTVQMHRRFGIMASILIHSIFMARLFYPIDFLNRGKGDFSATDVESMQLIRQAELYSIEVNRRQIEGEAFLLCRSNARKEKDEGIRTRRDTHMVISFMAWGDENHPETVPKYFYLPITDLSSSAILSCCCLAKKTSSSDICANLSFSASSDNSSSRSTSLPLYNPMKLTKWWAVSLFIGLISPNFPMVP
jgi:hypothetical protein